MNVPTTVLLLMGRSRSESGKQPRKNSNALGGFYSPVFLLTWAVLFFSQHAAALCLDSRHPELASEIASSKYVIAGEVTAATNDSEADDPAGVAGTMYAVQVINAWKGHPATTLRIRSENTSSRFPMNVGQRYLLFVADTSGDGFVDACGNSGVLSEREELVTALTTRRYGFVKR